jgi:hypothetical protein
MKTFTFGKPRATGQKVVQKFTRAGVSKIHESDYRYPRGSQKHQDLLKQEQAFDEAMKGGPKNTFEGPKNTC